MEKMSRIVALAASGPRSAHRWVTLLVTLLIAAPLHAFDPAERMGRVADALSAGEFSYARTLLEPVLLHPGISPKGRALAYFYQGLAYSRQNLHRSAAIANANAIDFDPDNVQALNALAYQHLRGTGINRDSSQALELYLRAAALDHPPSVVSAGLLLLGRNGIERDLTRAREILEAGAEGGDPEAMVAAGRAWRDADPDLPADPARAEQWFRKAASLGHSGGAMALGFLLRSQDLGDPQLAEAQAHFETAAEAGKPAAQAALAFLLMTGDGGEEDPERARYWYQQSAEAGDPQGALGYAYALDAGLGGPVDRAGAWHWYEVAAEAGSTNAQQRLGARHYARAEYDRAIHWLTRAASSGNVNAQNSLAWLLATATADAARNGVKAIEWARRAVDAEPSAAHIDTLAAAYAEAGRFDEAVTTQAKAIEALPGEADVLLPGFEERLAQYQSGNPWREPANSAAGS